MIKFLFLTDTHFRDDRPRGRTDNIMTAQFEELGEIIDIAREYDIDTIVHGGDFFHTKKPSHQLVAHIIDWVKTLDLPVTSVIGNHDVTGYNLDSVKNSGLGVLFECEAIECLNKMVWEKEKVVIMGVHSTLHFKDNYVFDKKYDGYKKIAISHNYVIPQDNMPFEFVHPKDIDTNADLVLCGHYHVPFDYSTEKTRWINPGALSRWSLNERNHKPQVLLVTVDKGNIEVKYIQLKTSKPGDQIFDEEVIQSQKNHEYDIDQFVNTLNSTSFEKMDIEDVVEKSGREQSISEPVLKIAIENIQKAKEVLK